MPKFVKSTVVTQYFEEEVESSDIMFKDNAEPVQPKPENLKSIRFETQIYASRKLRPGPYLLKDNNPRYIG